MAVASVAPLALLVLLIAGGLIALIVVLCTRKSSPPPHQPPQDPPAQAVALCPNCGAPVAIGEGRWQCPKCGSGDVLLPPPQQ